VVEGPNDSSAAGVQPRDGIAAGAPQGGDITVCNRRRIGRADAVRAG